MILYRTRLKRWNCTREGRSLRTGLGIPDLNDLAVVTNTFLKS